MDSSIVRSLGVGRFLDSGAANVGASGGILVFWDNMSLELVDLEVGLFSVLCHFRNVEDGFLWNFSEVYGPVFSPKGGLLGQIGSY